MNRIASRTHSTVLSLCITLGLLGGCASSQLASRPMSESDLRDQGAFLPSNVSSAQTRPLEGSLPFGIGAQINYFMDESASNIGGFYSSVVKPMRRGQIFASKAYVLDYAIRDRGHTFDNSVSLDKVRFRSHYDIRVGMTRKFHRFGDLLKPALWLGNPAYLNHNKKPDERNRPIARIDQSFFQKHEPSEPLVGEFDLSGWSDPR